MNVLPLLVVLAVERDRGDWRDRECVCVLQPLSAEGVCLSFQMVPGAQKGCEEGTVGTSSALTIITKSYSLPCTVI